jgi:hypothetical protein
MSCSFGFPHLGCLSCGPCDTLLPSSCCAVQTHQVWHLHQEVMVVVVCPPPHPTCHTPHLVTHPAMQPPHLACQTWAQGEDILQACPCRQGWHPRQACLV